MARADTASASLRSDSIQGLAKSIAKPAYRRLLSAEPLLRRAVPVLIIAFLITICVGAVVQVLEQRRQVIVDARQIIEALADELAVALDHPGRDGRVSPGRTFAALERALPAWATAQGRSIIVADANGTIIASVPSDPLKLGRQILDVLGPSQPLTTFGAAAGTLEITLPDGAAAFATVRALKNPLGIVAVAQTASSALTHWRSTTALTVTLSATTGFVVLILGFAFHWQATRAREADLIHDTVRGRIDTALNRGRCGLWDWDLARGRVFWSHSMFDILGLPAKNDLLTFGELNALVHDGDIDLYDLARQLADGKVQSIDHAFRMRHADGRWLWLRARCELARQEGETGLHLIGIAVDITEQKSLVEKTTAADLRLRDAIETIPEAFVLWDADNRLVLCNSNFQELHRLPDEAVVAGTPYETVVAAGQQADHSHHHRQRGRPDRKARAPSRRNSTTAAGCTSASAAPRTAVMSPSAPTSPRSSSTSRSSSKARSGGSRPSPTCASRSRRWNARPASLPTWRRNTPRKRPARKRRTRPNRSSSPI